MSPLFGGGGKRDDPGQRGRTPEEREAARLERERRRAEREGQAPAAASAEPAMPVEPQAFEEPPVPAESQAFEEPPVPVEPQAFEEPPVPVEPPAREDPPVPAPEPPAPEYDEPSAPHDPPPPQPEPAPDPAPSPAPAPPEPSRDDSTATVDAESSLDDDLVPEEGVVPEAAPASTPSSEAPAGVRRIGAPSVRDLPNVAAPRPHERPRPRGLPRQRRGARRAVLLLPLIVLVAFLYGVYRYAQPGHGDGTGSVRITVPSGSSAGDVANLLADKGVVDSAFFFSLRARLTGQRGDIKAGTFTLKRDMSYADALTAITHNPAPPPVLRVTIPEGRSIREAAPLVKESGFRGSYVKAASRSPRSMSALKGYNIPKGTRSLEGFLFPASYELKRRSTAKQLVAEQVGQFKREFSKLDLKAAKRKNLTSYDVLIIASMIEREAQVPKDRRLISAVIYNRLKQHIPLGIDATLRYRLNNWTRPLRQSELEADSPFNTRTRQGLPPAPIGSPGLASLQAAVDPANVDYLYYVVKPCGNGAHAFSSTDAQFQRDVAAYNRKRDQLGGKDPSHC